MTELIINFASRGRCDQFFKSLENITDTIETKNYKIFASFDYGDVMDDQDVRELIWDMYPKVEIVYGDHVSKVAAINRPCSLFGKFYWLINHSDDFIYLEEGWDAKMLESIKKVWGKSTDFFAHFSDGYTPLSTHNICGYDYFKRDKNIYDESYNSVSCDAENFWKAQMRGCYHYFPEVYFLHSHPANNHSIKTDATYLGNDKFDKPDTDNYFERMKHYFYVENPVMIPEQLEREIKNLR
jgi:hypothetical protein